MKLGELKKLAAALPDLQAPDIGEQLRKQVLLLGLDPDALYQELEMASAYVDICYHCCNYSIRSRVF